MLNRGILAISAADENESMENVITCAITPEKLAVESEITECGNSDTAHEQNVIDTTSMAKCSKDVSSNPTEKYVTESLNIENISIDPCPIISDQFAVDGEIIESTSSGIFAIADNQHAINSPNAAMLSPDAIERVNMENINSVPCEIISDQFAVDSSDIDIFNSDICASTSEENVNDNTNLEIIITEIGVITPDLFSIHTKNMENINFDTYDITHKQNVIGSSNIDIFDSEISATQERASESSNMGLVNSEACAITPENCTVEKENMGFVNSDIYAITHNQHAFGSSSINIFNSRESTVTIEDHAIESSNMKDASPNFCNTAEQLLFDSANMEIVNLGVCTITPEQLAIIDLKSNLEILNPDTCNPPAELVLDGISEVEITPTNLKTPGDDGAMRYTQVYLIDYPDLEKMDLQYTQTIDVQEELLKAFSIPSSSNIESGFLNLNEPQVSGTTPLEYAQTTENQDECEIVVHPAPGPYTNESEVTNEIDRETLLEYSDDVVNNREEVLPNLALSNVAVEPNLAAMNEAENGDTLLKYYQNIEDQLQFSDFEDPDTSLDESEFLALSEREDSATLNSEIPMDLADIRMESLIGSKVDKPPDKSTKVPPVPKDKPFLCCVCGYQSSFKRRYTVHMRTHTGEKPFSCGKCEYKCSDTGTLSKHLRTHSKAKQLNCKTCSYTCTEKSNLTKHILRHKGVKPFKCPDCRFTSAQSSDLRRHVLVHKGEKPLTCISCNVLCADRESLKRHFLMHEESFSCSECSYSNSRLEHLRKHMLSHRGGELYTCFYCQRPFITNLQLEIHMRTHSTHKPFSCSECRYSCTLKSTLLKHRLTHVAKKYQPTLTLWVSDAVNE